MHADFSPTVYILASKRNGTLYTGVTSKLLARIHQHREGQVRCFTRGYGVKLLVWFEQHATKRRSRRSPRLRRGTNRPAS